MSSTPSGIQQRIQQRKAELSVIRSELRQQRDGGTGGIACSHWLSDRIDRFVCDSFRQSTALFQDSLSAAWALLAIGGNGRRRPAPWSDIDLLVICDPRLQSALQPLVDVAMRDLWDAGVQPACTMKTIDEACDYATKDVQFATSVMEPRLLAGSAEMATRFSQQISGRALHADASGLILQLQESRRSEWIARGNSVNQLEPDVKRSPGGLRDIQLLRWVSFLRHASPEPEILQQAGDISERELLELRQADQFLTLIRLDLHLLQNLKQDVLTRELQLKISEQRGILGTDQARPVEVFMQQYFGHTSKVAAIARRVADVPRPLTLLQRLRNRFLPVLSRHGYQLLDGALHLNAAQLRTLQDPTIILTVFSEAAANRVRLAPEAIREITASTERLTDEPTYEQSEQFRELLRDVGGLSVTLRTMAETRFLEWLIPAFREIRNLMQFNQYHSFTVDEHTLKTIDEVAQFASEKTAVGSAYQEIRHRATLHLALLMHDIGKGRAGDHSIIGEQIAAMTAERLQLAANKRSMLMFLVRYHLIMPDLALRRDITDRIVLLDFARLVGAPELLRMLYCLTVADIRAVGPEVWTDWKGDLLADLYNRASLILSGRPYNHLERERIQKIRAAVRQSFLPAAGQQSATAEEWGQWADNELDSLPPLYLMNQQPERIARDLAVIQLLDGRDVKIEGEYDPELEIVSYRVYAPQRFASGSFHFVAGILSAMGMDIKDALICTSKRGFVISLFRVADRNFSGGVPHSRIEDVAVVIGDVLTARRKPEAVFRRSSLIRLLGQRAVIMRQAPKVMVDNDCSQQYTVIDVFAMDTQGLLFTLAQTIHEHGLTVHLARIATSVDQVVDVFYVLDENGHKLEDPERISQLRTSLLDEINKLTSA
ncbi:MAG TPA: [protein-PII] uridylyltransferase [Planctomycetaceae bacterium]|nr:[protein-PII] uridylyltransferase [Planctomycetaceae bacterium]